jgi:transcription termination factor Rho
MHLSELKALHVSQLLDMAINNNVDGANRLRKHELIFALLKNQARKGESIFGDGTLETLSDGFGFLRSPDTSYLASTDDIYVSPSQIRRFNLHTGDTIEGEIRTPKDGERYFALVKVDKINGEAARGIEEQDSVRESDAPAPGRTSETRARYSRGREHHQSHHRHHRAHRQGPARPARGQPEKRQDSHDAAHRARHHDQPPGRHLIVLLIDERPEEVTEMTRSVRGEVVASTFDEPATRHVQVAEMVIEKAKRLSSTSGMWSFCSIRSPAWRAPTTPFSRPPARS